MEENGALAAQVRHVPFCAAVAHHIPFCVCFTELHLWLLQVRSTFAQLIRAQDEVAKLDEAHSSSRAEWGNRRDVLQRELSQALTDRVTTHLNKKKKKRSQTCCVPKNSNIFKSRVVFMHAMKIKDK